MKNCVVVLVLVGLLFNFANSAKFPEDLPQCKHEDTSCLSNVITEIIGKHFDGHRGLHLIPIDPLKVRSLVIAQNTQSPVNIQLKFTDVQLIGFKNTKVYKTRGFQKDPKTATFEVDAKIPQLAVIGPYEIKGNVLILPISGKGPSNMTIENIDAKLKFTGGAEVKNGEEYLKFKDFKLSFEIGRIYYHFDNLFNGDKALGDNMNLFLNENWKEIFDELKDTIRGAISEVLEITIQTVFAGLPYKKLFLQ